MDKSWMTIKDRVKSEEYKNGVVKFIKFARNNLGDQEAKIFCPCLNCLNGKKLSAKEVYVHLIQKGIDPSYKTWVDHGEPVDVCQPSVRNDDDQYQGGGNSDIGEGDIPWDNDQLTDMLEEIYVGGALDDDMDKLPNPFESQDKQKFDKLFDGAHREVYSGCKKLVLSFTVKMLHIKVYNKMTNAAFDMVMDAFKEMLPECDDTVPWNLYECKKYLRDLGLGYVPIHACKYDCALFWGETADLEHCPKCKEPRYKVNDGKGKKIPHKILRYFPLTPRLKRLFMSKKIAADMRWHKEKCLDDGVLRHPADAKEWKDFDRRYPLFAEDS